MSIVKTDQIQDRNGNPLIAVADGVASGSFAPVGMRNKIINGDMRIDQRNNGAAVTGVNGAGFYSVDRWKSMAVNTWSTSAATFSMQRNANTLTPPPNFTNYLGVSVTTAEPSLPAISTHELTQVVEGFNLADLGWGTASAKPVTLSFWVRSNLTGTFGGSFTNSVYSRSYVFSYTIASANTWEYKTIAVPGETDGSWLTTNDLGVNVSFSLGAGSSMLSAPDVWNTSLFSAPTGQQQICASTSNVFYITGVQLEAGTVATPFERRQFGQELALCQRYFEKSYNDDVTPGTITAIGQITYQMASTSGSQFPAGSSYLVSKRANPTLVLYSPVTGTASRVYMYSGSAADQTVSSVSTGQNRFGPVTIGSSVSGNQYGYHFTASAEL